MLLTDFLASTENFSGGEDFPKLLTEGLALLKMSPRELAGEMGVIPATVLRWASGTAKPHPGVQKVAIAHLRKAMKAKPQCSFCGKSDVKKLIAGPACYICEECVALCSEIVNLDWERLRRIERAATAFCQAVSGSDVEGQLRETLKKAIKP